MIGQIISAAVGDMTELGFGIYDRDQDKKRDARDYAESVRQAEINRQYNKIESQKNRDFQERMSSTAYQRGMTDMKKAGLNPALMYTSSAGGSSSPSGTSASASSMNRSGGAPVSTPKIGKQDLIAMMSTAQDVKNKKEQNKILKNQASSAKSQAEMDKIRKKYLEMEKKHNLVKGNPWETAKGLMIMNDQKKTKSNNQSQSTRAKANRTKGAEFPKGTSAGNKRSRAHRR